MSYSKDLATTTQLCKLTLYSSQYVLIFYQWTQVRTRKTNLVRLFERMQNYQYEVNSDPDTILEMNVRALTEEDLDR